MNEKQINLNKIQTKLERKEGKKRTIKMNETSKERLEYKNEV